MRILALDLSKYKTVVCDYQAETVALVTLTLKALTRRRLPIQR
jgi:hypothetical protein